MQGTSSLILALSLGFGAIEVDTYLAPITGPYTKKNTDIPPSSLLNPDLTLLVGHELPDLDSSRTLSKIYLDSLMEILDKNNADVEKNWVGLYPDDPTAEVILSIDMKNSGEAIWPYLVESLQPFLAKGYLTTYNTSTSTWSRGPIMIVGTGNTPISAVYHSTLRYIFYDAPLLTISSPITIPKTSFGPSTSFEWNGTISPIASSKLPLRYHLALLMPKCNVVVEHMRKYAQEAQARGVKSRWWGVARIPRDVRQGMWVVQRRGGVSWMNGDDLTELAVWLLRHPLEESDRKGRREDGTEKEEENRMTKRGEVCV
ncbi:hypothetical protein M231_03069 [Tremella mesenterica]|uniref:Uncharacterized protein n=1 Tax=Tremella mesenterica TaxID=5217 RepID=A0A4Q1BPA1_TREME|nr:hypothetical protein M231_03069 [Tremella mesenterica]